MHLLNIADVCRDLFILHISLLIPHHIGLTLVPEYIIVVSQFVLYKYSLNIFHGLGFTVLLFSFSFLFLDTSSPSVLFIFSVHFRHIGFRSLFSKYPFSIQNIV